MLLRVELVVKLVSLFFFGAKNTIKIENNTNNVTKSVMGSNGLDGKYIENTILNCHNFGTYKRGGGNKQQK